MMPVVEVKEIDARLPIADQQYVAITFENHALVVDAIKGTTRVIPLDDKNLTGEARQAAILDSAKVTAQVAGFSRVYVLRYDLKPNEIRIFVP